MPEGPSALGSVSPLYDAARLCSSPHGAKCPVLHWAPCVVTRAHLNCSASLCPEPLQPWLRPGATQGTDAAFLFAYISFLLLLKQITTMCLQRRATIRCSVGQKSRPHLTEPALPTSLWASKEGPSHLHLRTATVTLST